MDMLERLKHTLRQAQALPGFEQLVMKGVEIPLSIREYDDGTWSACVKPRGFAPCIYHGGPIEAILARLERH
jgi:hypothetical protein